MMYSTGQMTDRTGATARQLTTWADRGWLQSKTQGTGHSRMWCESDLQRATLMMRFITAGFSLDKAYKFMTVIRNREDPRTPVRIRIGTDMWVIVKGL
jgi:DNA-binding transcriptional MerR regulator